MVLAEMPPKGADGPSHRTITAHNAHDIWSGTHPSRNERLELIEVLRDHQCLSTRQMVFERSHHLRSSPKQRYQGTAARPWAA